MSLHGRRIVFCATLVIAERGAETDILVRRVGPSLGRAPPSSGIGGRSLVKRTALRRESVKCRENAESAPIHPATRVLPASVLT